jgi:hypothetical protein
VDSGLTWDGGDAVTITGATQADPVVITAASHGFADGEFVKILSVGGMTELNGNVYKVANKTDDTFELNDEDDNDIDGTEFTEYTEGGMAQQVAKAITGFDHLVAEELSILADGGAVASQTVDSDGAIELDEYANKVHGGIGITWKLQPLNIEAGASAGTAQGKKMRIHRLSIRFQDTMACQVGSNTDNVQDITFRTDSDPTDEPVPLFTGDKSINKFPGGYGDGEILLMGTAPLPCTIVALMPELRTEDML